MKGKEGEKKRVRNNAWVEECKLEKVRVVMTEEQKDDSEYEYYSEEDEEKGEKQKKPIHKGQEVISKPIMEVKDKPKKLQKKIKQRGVS